jgi:hypothetical protein
MVRSSGEALMRAHLEALDLTGALLEDELKDITPRRLEHLSGERGGALRIVDGATGPDHTSLGLEPPSSPSPSSNLRAVQVT